MYIFGLLRSFSKTLMYMQNNSGSVLISQCSRTSRLDVLQNLLNFKIMILNLGQRQCMCIFKVTIHLPDSSLLIYGNQETYDCFTLFSLRSNIPVCQTNVPHIISKNVLGLHYLLSDLSGFPIVHHNKVGNHTHKSIYTNSL